MYMNLFAERECRVWTVLDWGDKEDLSLNLLPEEQVFSLFENEFENQDENYPYGPAWFIYDILANGLDDLIQPETSGDMPTWMEWALLNGLTPLQPFELIIPKPHYYRTYEGDYDADYYWDIGQQDPLHDQVKSHRWAHYFKSIDIFVKDFR